METGNGDAGDFLEEDMNDVPPVIEPDTNKGPSPKKEEKKEEKKLSPPVIIDDKKNAVKPKPKPTETDY